MEDTGDMKRTKTLAGAAVLLAVVAIATAPRNVTPSAFLDQGEPFFPDFEDPNVATTLEVIEFDETTAAARPFKVQNEGGIWTIPSHHDYPADGEDRLAETAAGVIEIKKDDFRSDNVADHELLGVIDPLDETETSLVGRGTRVTIKGENERILANIIFGNNVEGREGFKFVRMPDQKRVYAAKVDLELSTKFEDWIEKDLLQVEQSKIDHVVLQDYSINERTLRIDQRDTVILDKEDGEWTMDRLPSNQEVDSTKINDLLRAIADLSIVGVRPKPAGVSVTLQRVEERLPISPTDVLALQSKGYYLTQTGDLMSNEGEVQVRTTEGIRYTLRFGEVLYGSGEAVSAGTDQSDDEAAGPGENRYLFLTAEFNPSLFPEPPRPANTDFEDKEADEDKRNKELADAYEEWEEKLQKGREPADELTQRFAKWYYVISAESFDKIHLERSDLLKDKEAEET